MLTKPLGVGAIATALKRGAAGAAERCPRRSTTMAALNAAASEAALAAGAHAATDVTGFGLLGHAHQLARESGVAVELDAAAVPVLKGAEALLRGEDAVSGGSRRNRAWADSFTSVAPSVPEWRHRLAADATTSGGLLVALPPARAGDVPGAVVGASSPATRAPSSCPEGWRRRPPAAMMVRRVPGPASLAAAADPAKIDEFYRAFASVSFTLLGLWWVVVQLRYREGEGDVRGRRHAYGIALFFLLPGVMSLLSSVNSEHSALWRLAFGGCAALGIVEIALYLRSEGRRTPAGLALRWAGLVLYVLMAALALRPRLSVDLALGLTPREAEAVLLALLLVVGANLAVARPRPSRGRPPGRERGAGGRLGRRGGRDDPGRGGRDDVAVRAGELAQRPRAARRRRRRAGARARSPASRRISPAGPERHDELDRLVEVAADQDRQVAAAQRRRRRSRRAAGCSLDGVGVGHRERAGAAGRLVVLLGALDDLLDDRLRAVEPVVVDPPAPDDHREPAARARAPRARCAARRTGLAKNIVPMREKAQVEAPRRASSVCTSATRKRAFATPGLVGLLAARPR